MQWRNQEGSAEGASLKGGPKCTKFFFQLYKGAMFLIIQNTLESNFNFMNLLSTIDCVYFSLQESFSVYNNILCQWSCIYATSNR